MFKFEVRENHPIKLPELAKMFVLYANDQWIGDHFTEDQAAESMLDMFNMQVLADLEMIELVCKKES